MKRLCYVMLMLCILFLFFVIRSAWGQNNHAEFVLKGFEIAKGMNIDEETRVRAALFSWV